MSEERLTIGRLLFPPGWEAEAHDDNPKLKEVQETIRKELRSADMFAVSSALLNKIAALLDDQVLDALAGGWSKSVEILKYRDREKYPPQNSYLIALGEHTVSHECHPSIDLFINNVRHKTLEFVVKLAVELKGFQLEIQDARIRKIHTGAWAGSGSVTLSGMEIYKKELKPVALPGIVDLGEGWLIGESRPGAAPTQPQSGSLASGAS